MPLTSRLTACVLAPLLSASPRIHAVRLRPVATDLVRRTEVLRPSPMSTGPPSSNLNDHAPLSFVAPSTPSPTASDLHRGCLPRLCCTFKLSQPLDALFRLLPAGLVSCRKRPWGLSLQRFPPNRSLPRRSRLSSEASSPGSVRFLGVFTSLALRLSALSTSLAALLPLRLSSAFGASCPLHSCLVRPTRPSDYAVALTRR